MKTEVDQIMTFLEKRLAERTAKGESTLPLMQSIAELKAGNHLPPPELVHVMSSSYILCSAENCTSVHLDDARKDNATKVTCEACNSITKRYMAIETAMVAGRLNHTHISVRLAVAEHYWNGSKR